MSRRSARLVSGGYYQSDDDSDSSSVTTISYRESPVRVFKKKAGSRKAASHPISRTNSNASSASTDRHNVKNDITSYPAPPLQDIETQRTMRTVPYSPSTTATPRPALAPGRGPAAPPEKRPRPLEPGQSSVDSSGYSSSEGHRTTAGGGRNSQTVSLSSVVSAVQSRVVLLTDRAAASFTSPMKKRSLGLLLLLLLLAIAVLSIWLLLASTKTPIPTPPQSQPVPPQPGAGHPAPVVDAAVVSAMVEEKTQRLLGELLLKQESLYSLMEERLQLEMQGMRARLEALDSDSSGLSRQLADYQEARRSDAAGLHLRIQAVEAQNAKLSQELSSIQMSPPPAPCPDPSSAPHNQLTPELQQALERWLTDRIKQEQHMRLGDKGTTSDCGRPAADDMADFALESQGASVVSTRCSETYRIRSACVTLFGFPLWYPSESPRTVIQGFPVLLPGKCWAFHGVQGSLVLSLSHPIRITHVTLDHLRRCNSPTGRIDSAPKDFQVYAMTNDTEEGTLLGSFTYRQDGESTQTFHIPSPSDVVYRLVELRILSNWGLIEYTCVYRFRVHGKMASN